MKNKYQKTKEYIIGVDGGGTKTTIALADLSGSILKLTKSGPSNPRKLGIGLAVNNVALGIVKLLPKGKKTKISSTFIGLPAVEEDFKFRIKEIRKEFLKHKEISLIFQGKVFVGSDQIVAFRAGSDQKDGVVLIAGTGTVAHGWRGKKEAKASGWGWLTDEGSASWVGQKVYQAILKDLDGRAQKTLLKKLVFQEFKLKKNEDLLRLNRLIYEDPFRIIPTLSIICEKAAEKEDKVAKDILIKAAKEEALSASTVIKRLGFQKVEFPLVLAGSMFKSKIILNKAKKEIKKSAPKVKFIQSKEEPVAGAVKLALEQLNEDFKG